MSLQVAALHQLGSLTSRLGTVTTSLLTDSSLKLLDTVFSALLSPWLPVRLAAGQCVRQVAVAVPSVPDKPEWKLDGQMMSLTLPLTETVNTIKQRIMEELGMPQGKQKIQHENIFLKVIYYKFHFCLD